MKNKLTTIAVLVLATTMLSFPANAQTVPPKYSELWGENGERCDPDGILPDFTNVGYMEGNMPIPDWPVEVNVRDYGAVGDGENDDTQAFLDAIAACPERRAILPKEGITPSTMSGWITAG